MNRTKGKTSRGGAKRAKSVPPASRNISNKSRRRSKSNSQKQKTTSRRSSIESTNSQTSNKSVSGALFVPTVLPSALKALNSISKPTSKLTTVGQAILTNLQDFRGIVWQQLCTMLESLDGGNESYKSDCKLSFIDAYIKTTSSLEANLNEMNRDYLKQLVFQRRPENDDMFLDITQELFRLQRLFTAASSSGKVCVSSTGRAKDPKAASKSSGVTKSYRVNSNPLAEVAVRDMDALGRLLESFFHGETNVIDGVPDHCYWMRRNILMRCSAREHSAKNRRLSADVRTMQKI